MNQIELQGQVLSLLEDFKGIEPLKELFWSKLNYDRVNRPTSRRGWPEPVASLLADDPTLMAAGGQSGDFQVLYSRLAKDRLSLADERIVTSRLLTNHPYSLFVFSDRTQTNWHFLNVKMAEEAEKRKLYRRVTVGPSEKMRTASQVISQLDLSSVTPNLVGVSPLVIQEHHDQAFDVEPVTEEFFREYHSTFTQVESLIRGVRDTERKRLFTQRLFNRLMFIAFIQKKGWLQFGRKENHDYLNALWADYMKNGNREMGFYHERLYILFFHGLGAQDDIGIININRGGFLRDVIGTVPYLNGGLFEEDDDDKDGGIKVPDEALRAILQGLFNHFNFTVTEATPLDVEVAVDPEMLGKVFEELVTGRHETGSYYTPKPIVSFMCREALKSYLESSLAKEKPEVIAQFVDEHEPSALRDAETVLETLRRVRVCDPACGSGAYLLGMLHELMDLRTCLFSAKKVDPLSAYDRKLEIIQRNVYGVDLDPFAVNIARLRLWLSLAVEFEGDDPPPLPNLKFEIEEGDSLSSPGPEPQQGVMWMKEIEQFGEAKAKYIKAHGPQKHSLEQSVMELKRSIASWTHQGNSVLGFDWAVEYADVFRDGGFDITLANPPYVRMELFKDQKPTLKRNFAAVHSERADLYCYFYARAAELLRTKGVLAFISSNKWLRAIYGANLRRYLGETFQVRSVTDFGDLPVFKSAAAYPMIFIARKEKPQSPYSFIFTEVLSLDSPYPDMAEVARTFGTVKESNALSGSDWSLTANLLQGLHVRNKKNSVELGEYCRGKIFMGVKTGLNQAFVIDSRKRSELLHECPEAKAIIKRFVVGRDLGRWAVVSNDRWLIYMHHGIATKGLAPILKHLRQYRTELEGRATCQQWYELQQPQMRYRTEFEGPKILFQEIATYQAFAFDPSGSYTNNKAYMIPLEDYYLLAVLNSAVAWSVLNGICPKLHGGTLRMQSTYVAKLPVPNPSELERNALTALVRQCFQGVEHDSVESEIEQRVAELYGVRLADIDPFPTEEVKGRKVRRAST